MKLTNLFMKANMVSVDGIIIKHRWDHTHGTIDHDELHSAKYRVTYWNEEDRILLLTSDKEDTKKKPLSDSVLLDLGFKKDNSVYTLSLSGIHFSVVPSFDSGYDVRESSDAYYTSPHEYINLKTIGHVYEFIAFLGSCRGKWAKAVEINRALDVDSFYTDNIFEESD